MSDRATDIQSEIDLLATKAGADAYLAEQRDLLAPQLAQEAEMRDALAARIEQMDKEPQKAVTAQVALIDKFLSDIPQTKVVHAGNIAMHTFLTTMRAGLTDAKDATYRTKWLSEQKATAERQYSAVAAVCQECVTKIQRLDEEPEQVVADEIARFQEQLIRLGGVSDGN